MCVESTDSEAVARSATDTNIAWIVLVIAGPQVETEIGYHLVIPGEDVIGTAEQAAVFLSIASDISLAEDAKNMPVNNTCSPIIRAINFNAVSVGLSDIVTSFR